MANKKLTVTTYIVRDGVKIKLNDLPFEEQKRLANEWNRTAMESAGFMTTNTLEKAV